MADVCSTLVSSYLPSYICFHSIQLLNSYAIPINSFSILCIHSYNGWQGEKIAILSLCYDHFPQNNPIHCLHKYCNNNNNTNKSGYLITTCMWNCDFPNAMQCVIELRWHGSTMVIWYWSVNSIKLISFCSVEWSLCSFTYATCNLQRVMDNQHDFTIGNYPITWTNWIILKRF